MAIFSSMLAHAIYERSNVSPCRYKYRSGAVVTSCTEYFVICIYVFSRKPVKTGVNRYNGKQNFVGL